MRSTQRRVLFWAVLVGWLAGTRPSVPGATEEGPVEGEGGREVRFYRTNP